MTTTDSAITARRPPFDEAVADAAPRLADDVELIGEYADSGFKQPPYIVRRGDGQVIQMPWLLYAVAEAVDGERDYAEIGEYVSPRIGRGLDAEGAKLLVEEKLRPIGIVALEDGTTPELEKFDPLLALRMKTAVVPERVVNRVTRLFRPFFWPPLMLALLVAFVGLDVWLFVFHGVAQSLRQTLYDPMFILLLLALIVVSAAFHECGHATACAYGGARPGAMGVGIYIVWPAFYTDVTDAYRLGKRGRLRTDLGGVYFNSIFTLATFGVYFVTGWEPLLIVVPLQIMEMLHQFLPFIRLDGYYIVSDLTGVPDMFARIKPTLKSLNPLDATPPEVRALKPWVRGAVTFYVFTVVPLLLFLLGLTVVNAPRIVATGWNSLLLQNLKLHRHVAYHAYLQTFVDAIQMAVLVLPIAGLFAMFWKLGRTLVTGAWARTEGRRIARVLLVATTAIAASAAAYVWLPRGNYQAIAATERGTIGGGIREFGRFGHPRPVVRPPAGGGMSTVPGRKPPPTPPSRTTATTSTTGGAGAGAPPATSGTATTTSPAKNSTSTGTTKLTGTTPTATTSSRTTTASEAVTTTTAPTTTEPTPTTTATTTPTTTETTPTTTNVTTTTTSP
jgi:putative peptide zinc metalloprotease protein